MDHHLINSAHRYKRGVLRALLHTSINTFYVIVHCTVYTIQYTVYTLQYTRTHPVSIYI